VSKRGDSPCRVGWVGKRLLKTEGGIGGWIVKQLRGLNIPSMLSKVSNHSEEFLDAQIWLSERHIQTGCIVWLSVRLISSRSLFNPHLLVDEMSTVFSSASVWSER
jgi:hypothetical protein